MTALSNLHMESYFRDRAAWRDRLVPRVGGRRIGWASLIPIRLKRSESDGHRQLGGRASGRPTDLSSDRPTATDTARPPPSLGPSVARRRRKQRKWEEATLSGILHLRSAQSRSRLLYSTDNEWQIGHVSSCYCKADTYPLMSLDLL